MHHDAGVDDVVQARQREVVRDFAAEVVDDQQVAVRVAVNVFAGLAVVAVVPEAFRFEIPEQGDRRFVDNVCTLFDEDARDGGGQMRFAESRCADIF